MADESNDDSFESRVKKALDTVDAASRKLEDSIREKFSKDPKPEGGGSGEEEGASDSSDTESLLVRTQEGIEKFGSRITSSVENANIPEKASGLGIGELDEGCWKKDRIRLEGSRYSPSLHHPCHRDIPNCTLAGVSLRGLRLAWSCFLNG